MANTCLPQSLVITNFNQMKASGNQRCIALPCHYPNVTFTRVTRPCLDPSFAFLHSNSPHDTILTKQTKHQAFAPSGPMLLSLKCSSVRAEFCFRCLDPSLRFSPHDTILNKQTKHQALAPSGPMFLAVKSRHVRVEFCCKAWANAWEGQETHDLRNTMKHTAHIIPQSCKMVSRLCLFFKLANATTYWQETDP